MAEYRPYGYQYETSPRKLEPDYEKKKSPYKKKKSTSRKSTNPSNKTKKKAQYNVKPIMCIVIGFAMLFTICYRNSLINENYNKKEAMKTQLTQIEKENEQLKVGIESSLNLNSVEKTAEDQLGMQKLNNSQKVYVSLQKKDYVEPATEEVEINKNTSWFDKILNSLTKVIK